MKPIKSLLALLLMYCFSATALYAQTEKEQILTLRAASNQALKALDRTKVLSFLTDDVLVTTGNGTLLTSKKALEDYILEAGDSKMYWVRTAQEIELNEKRGLAWENGFWNGYNPEKSDDAIVGGKYSAMWTKASGEWKIKSQLFVTLEEN